MDEAPAAGRPSERDARLARIERRIDEIGAVLEELRGRAEPSERRRLDLARALGRLGVAIWAAGLLALTAGTWIAGLEAGRSPVANVCAGDEAAEYAECLRDPAPAGDETLLGGLRRRLLGAEVAPEREVPRTATERYRTSLRRVAGVAVGWTVVVLASAGVVGWIARGLRPRR